MPISTGTLVITLEETAEFESSQLFFWFASGTPDEHPEVEMRCNDSGEFVQIAIKGAAILASGGPFDTEAEADAAARKAVVGDAVVRPGGQWDPAWDKPQ
jgi:hypothetical protein